MEIKYFHKGFNYSQDGCGNRLVIHLQGCNLHCPWCSNPEGISGSSGISIDTDDLFREIESCKRLFFDGGGVTFTGGECTVQSKALFQLLEKCCNAGIDTAIETNGTYSFPIDKYKLIGSLISDFKHYDHNILKSIIGCNYDYKTNISNYLKYGKKVIIRTVLINGFNANLSDAEQFASFFDGLNTENTEFEFLAYHEYGKVKWEKLGKEYVMKNAFVTDETVNYFYSVYKNHGFKTIRS